MDLGVTDLGVTDLGVTGLGVTGLGVTDLGPEFRLFCLALRRPQSADVSRQMRGLAAAVGHWDSIVHGARRHRVAHVVLEGLRACGSPHIPARIVARLQQLGAATMRRSLAQTAEVGRLSRLFAEAGVRVLVLKGIALATQLYGEPARRATRDIDLLVDRDQFSLAQQVMLEAGYRQRLNLQSRPRHSAYLALIKELEYSHAATGELVELHHRLTANPNLLSVPFASLWNEREELSPGGSQVSTLSRHRLPLYLCVHGADHGWARLHWLIDFAAAMQKVEDVDAVLAAADEVGLRSTFLHALVLAHDWLGLPIENRALDLYRNNAQAKRLRWLLDRLYASTDWYERAPKRELRYALWERLYRFSLKPDWRYRADHLKADWFCPADWDSVPLPPALFWLYPLVRPWGWLVRRLSPS